MGSKKRNNSNFLVQGSILAIASVISRIIGMIYRFPLTSIIGDVGNDYLSAAMEVYSILLLISSYSLPLAVSKLVSTRVAKGERKNAYRIFKGALVFAFFSGTLVALFLFFGADWIASLLKTPLSVFALQVLSPTLLVVAILGVFRGFFQGMGTMMPSAVSQLLEQVVNAIVSLWVAYMLYQYGVRIGRVLGNSEHYGSAYGAAGSTAGTGAGAVFALLFVLLVFSAFLPVYKKQMKREVRSRKESYGRVFSVLILTIIPVLLSTTIYNITSILDMGVFKYLAAYQGYQEIDYSTMWGVFAGKYKTLVNVPISLASALAASSVPSVATAFASENMRLVKERVHSVFHFIMVIAFPCAVGMGVLALPLMNLMYPPRTELVQSSNEMAANLMRAGALSILCYSLSTVSNAILQGINRMRMPVLNALAALILHLILLAGLMLGLDLNIYAVVIANVCFSLLMCLLNGWSIWKALHYRQEIRKTFLIPGIASLLMGVAVYGCYEGLMALLKSNLVATVASVALGVLIYFVLLFLMKGMESADLKDFPGGRFLRKIMTKLHLLRG